MIGRRVAGMMAGVVALAASAWAQDYTVTTATGQIESRPANATQWTSLNSWFSLSGSTVVTLPFTFHYYGKPCTTLMLGAEGVLIPGGTTQLNNAGSNSSPHGQDSTSGAFPYGGTGSSSADGIIAPLWTSINVNDAQFESNPGYVYTWTSGTAPNRRFVIAWDNVSVHFSTNPRTTIQCHLYETTGRIVFAYSNTSSSAYTGATWVLGLDSPDDSRFTAPVTAGRLNTGYPGSDFIFDPQSATFTGTVLYDRIIADQNGIGPSEQGNVPIPRCRIELQRNDGHRYVSSTTGDDGSFSVTGVGLPSGTPGRIAVYADNSACDVVDSQGSTWLWAAVSPLSFASGANLGAYTLGSGADPNGDTRASFHVAATCLAARDWVAARTADPIPRLGVSLNSSSASNTTYQPANGLAPPYAVIAGRTTPNSDVWDAAIITRTYARHLLASIAGSPTSTADYRFDAVTDSPNAFAEAFGYALWAAISGSSTAIDAAGPSSAVVYDLETPAVSVTKGPNVTGCMAGALNDLVDGANEIADVVGGGSSADYFVRATDAIAVAPNAATFLQSWVDAGYDSAGITRAFVGNRVLPDDGAEPNDLKTEPTVLGNVGVLRTGYVLNRFNEDWFTTTLPAAATSLMADVRYDQLTTGADVQLEIRNASDSVIATGQFLSSVGATRAVVLTPAAGTYRIRIRHVSGGTVPTYDLQVYVPPSMDSKPVHDWTVGRPYDIPLGARDGILPYAISASSGALPPGLVFDAAGGRAFGTPTETGEFALTVRLSDAGNPTNVTSRTEVATIHDVLKIGVARFVGFPAGRAVDATLPTIDGTPPFTLTMPSGALPEGLALQPGTFHVTGTAAAQASTTLELDGVDVAGSADHVATRAVVAAATDVPNAPTDLVAGVDACGWWFDAVQGSTVSFKAKTSKGRVKRLLAAAVLAPDRSEVLTAKVKGKLGGLSVSKLVCPLSGRYYVIAASEDGEATQLLGNVSVAAPKSGKAKLVDFTQTDTTEIEVGALPGATLTLKMKGDKKQQLTPKVVSVTDPDGTPVVFGGNVVTDGVAATLTMTLAKGGTWTVVVGATSATGTPGKLSYSYKLAQPKDAAYSAD